MDREIILTRDGSHSIAIPGMHITYHSIHGAIQESQHVFIDAGFNHVQKSIHTPLHIFEMGMGTGLNVLLTLLESRKINQTVHYTAIELFPLDENEMQSLNYCQQLNADELQTCFEQIHLCKWNEDVRLSDKFVFKKIKADLKDISLDEQFDLIYYDAFAPTSQPELWIESIFSKLYHNTAPQGILVTYCSKSDVQRAMKAAGWAVEKIPGPRGKREMVRREKCENVINVEM